MHISLQGFSVSAVTWRALLPEEHAANFVNLLVIVESIRMSPWFEA